MDTKNIYNINKEELDEETLSFCNLSLENQDFDDGQPLTFHRSSPSSPSHHELFEFPFNPKTPLNNKNHIVFCGKLIKEQQDFDGNGNDDHQSRYLFPLSSASQLSSNKKDLGSLYLVNSSKPNPSSLSTKSFRSRSCSLRKHNCVLIGITKMPPRMELSDIKKRQSRRNPLPMFPPPPPEATGDKEVVDADDSCGASGRRGHRWSLLRPLKCRVYLLSALAKASLGCIPHV